MTADSITLAKIAALRSSLVAEETPLPVRFRALFSLKHVARTNPPESAESLAAIEAIAAAFGSPSALLKHELAYCLGQTGNPAALAPLTEVLEDLGQDAMVRHEAAEALGALGKTDSLEVLKKYRDREGEEVCVKETCEIAIDRIEWENSEEKDQEKLKARYVSATILCCQNKMLTRLSSATSPPSTRPRQCLLARVSKLSKNWARP